MSFGQEIMQGKRDGIQTAVRTLFVQFDGGSEFLEVLEVLESCASSCLMIRKCTKQMLKCSKAEMRVML